MLLAPSHVVWESESMNGLDYRKVAHGFTGFVLTYFGAVTEAVVGIGVGMVAVFNS